VLFYAHMPILLCGCQSFIKESYFLTYLQSRFPVPEHFTLKNAQEYSIFQSKLHHVNSNSWGIPVLKWETVIPISAADL